MPKNGWVGLLGVIVLLAGLYLLVRLYLPSFLGGKYLTEAEIVVLDSETKYPIIEANVEAEYFDIAKSIELNKTSAKTEGNGIAHLNLPSIHKFRVAKEGYHSNGVNLTKNSKDFEYTIYLNKKKNISKRAYIEEQEFKNGDKVDLLSMVHNINFKNPQDFEISKDFDFLITQDGEKVFIEANKGAGILSINTEDDHDPVYWGDKCFLCFNTFFAPDSGYQNKLEIKERGLYILKLRDGKHFGKLYFNFGSYPHPIHLSFYSSLNEGKNVEFEDEITSEEKDMQLDYKLKEVYYKLSQISLREKHYLAYYDGTRILLENGLSVYPQHPDHIITMCDKNLKPEDISKSVISIKPVLPTWEVFKNMYNKLSDNGNYSRPNEDFYPLNSVYGQGKEYDMNIVAELYIDGKKVTDLSSSTICLE